LDIGGIVLSLKDICLGEGSGALSMASVKEMEKGISREECEEWDWDEREASILTSALKSQSSRVLEARGYLSRC